MLGVDAKQIADQSERAVIVLNFAVEFRCRGGRSRDERPRAGVCSALHNWLAALDIHHRAWLPLPSKRATRYKDTMVFPPFDPAPPPRARRFKAIPVRTLLPNLITLLALCAG